MNNKKLLLVTLSLVSVSAFAAQERVIKLQNHVRLGYDDNVYQSANKDGSGFLTEMVNLTGTFNFSERTDLVLYWQPELRYRFDADPEVVTYQDAYARLNHAISQRVFLQVSDRLGYREREGQADATGNRDKQNYLENSLLGALDITVDSLSQVNLGAGFDIRKWDDDTYGKVNGNNYDQFTLNATYIRELEQDTTKGVAGISYSDLSYDGNRGGYQSTALFVGADQNFSSTLSGTARAGFSMTDIDFNGGSSDSTSPYLQGGLRYAASEQTSVNGTLGYSVSRAQTAGYNTQDQLSLGLGVTHDVTAKISVSSTLGYTLGTYDAENGTAATDADVSYLSWSLRGSYQVNRNNFLEAGYQFSDRSGDLTEFDRSRIDFGWRLRL